MGWLDLLDKNGEFTNVSADLSKENYVVIAKQRKKPVISVLYQKNEIPRIVLGFPIIQEGTNQYMGLVPTLMPATMFGSYGNIYGITSQ